MRTKKQIKAFKRNFMIMYLTGVVTMLDKFINFYVCNPYWKRNLTEVAAIISFLIKRIRDTEDYQNHIY